MQRERRDRSERREKEEEEEDIARMEESVGLCWSALRSCQRVGILRRSAREQWESADAFKLTQWRGDGLLACTMRRHVAQSCAGKMHLSEMARLERACISSQALSQVFQEVQLDYILERTGATARARADMVEAVVWELNQHQQDHAHRDGLREDTPAIAGHALERLLDALMTVGRQILRDAPTYSRGKAEGVTKSREQALMWLRQYQAAAEDQIFTHSSMFGRADHASMSGKFCIPDDAQTQRILREIIGYLYEQQCPRCFVEMSTPLHPLIEDIDILGSADVGDVPPDDILPDSFFPRRAEVLHSLFPGIETLELSMFTASGWSTDYARWKTSFHLVWNSIIVDMPLAAAVRVSTIEAFKKMKDYAEFYQDLEKLDARNSLETLFDVTAVRAGSFRMPYNDKVFKPFRRREARPLLPVGVFCFPRTPPDYSNGAGHFLFGPEDLSKVEWLERASVRMPDRTDVTPFVPMLKKPPPVKAEGGKSKVSSLSSLSSTGRSRKDRLKQAKVRWDAEQRTRRRYWPGTAEDFKRTIDEKLNDEHGWSSTFMRVQTNQGKTRWLWSNRHLKGAIEITEDDGEVFIRGNAEQQMCLIELTKQFTEEWTGAIPTPSKKTKALKIVGKKPRAKSTSPPRTTSVPVARRREASTKSDMSNPGNSDSEGPRPGRLIRVWRPSAGLTSARPVWSADRDAGCGSVERRRWSHAGLRAEGVGSRARYGK